MDNALYGDKEVKFMNLEELYISLHGDYADAKARLMSDRLVEKFVLKFPSDPSMQELRDAVASGDNASAFRAVHTLKGPADEELLKKLEDAYKLVIDSIKAFTI